MAKKKLGRKTKESVFSRFDWSVNPETTREISAVVLIIIGIFFMLSIFSVAGKIGYYIARFFDYSLGIIGYLLPFVVIAVGVVLWNPKKYTIKASSVIGLFLCFLFVPALFSPYGGVVGLGISALFKGLVGGLASYIILVGFSAVALLITLNTSIKSLIDKLLSPTVESPNVNIHGVQSQKVSVFATMREKVGLNGRAAPTSQANKPVLTQKDTTWDFPPLDLLSLSNVKATSGNISKNVEIIQKTLKDFGIDVSMGDVNIGPTVTQYTLKPTEGVKLAAITARSNDIALALAAHPIRIEAPIPGKSAVGIEVPNKVPAIVTIREILETPEFKTAAGRSNLSIALGRDVAGAPFIIDLKRMPHLLVAGATGSGKSICLHGIILSFLYQNSPSQLKLLFVDPKRVEFTHYNGIPHLLASVITDVDKTVSVLKWAVSEMERRFNLFSETHRRDIESYNQNPASPTGGPTDGKLPYIVIVIDELADLMAQAANEVEAAIVRLSQMARATGIHLVVATQRPSVDVITGLIKANITSRIAFAVASQIDSRTIIDQSGAEKLLGKGDMLYIGSDLGKPKRIQGVLLEEKEVKSVNDWLKKGGLTQYDESIANYSTKRIAEGIGDLDDDLLEEAKMIVAQAGKASASLLQRRLRVGYARAARLLDILEHEGIIGPADGAKPRDVLIDTMSLDSAPPPSYQQNLPDDKVT